MATLELRPDTSLDLRQVSEHTSLTATTSGLETSSGLCLLRRAYMESLAKAQMWVSLDQA